ncbi:MAG: hypothetical protein UY21_C0001G0069 [Microgenomates group bacterium GW2011_GWA1_48_10]|nr:MAG: hypothetical protein UY21_C0001G0069 [Microgenomates group bacterium GW2011_GWA1_48_10]
MAKIFATNKKLILVFLCLLAANVAIFWQFYFRGLLPFPGDLLVSFFFPWNSGGFANFDQWTTHKEVIAADVIRQMYPWKALLVNAVKNGTWPLWNPYNFSGTPLLANLQSSVFFPANVVFLFLPRLVSWISLVIFLPLIFSIFCYLFLRSLNISRLASLLGAIILSNISYLLVWSEQLVFIQSVLFLPLSLLLINYYSVSKKPLLLLLLPLTLSFAVFGGHIQTVVYVCVVVTLYALFRRLPIKYLFIIALSTIGLSSLQLLPSLELYLYSAREGNASAQLFLESVLPIQNLATILAPDFFGNPATGNFFGSDYGNNQVYFGVLAAFFSVVGLYYGLKGKKSLTLFFALVGLGGLVFSLDPFARLFLVFKIPVLSSAVAARGIFIFQFCFAVVAALGIDQFLANTRKRAIITIFFLFLGFYLLLYFSTKLIPNHATIAQKNLVLPLLVLLSTGVTAFLSRFRRQAAVVLILIATLEYAYFFNKFAPFARREFVFPGHPVFNFLTTRAEVDRFYGFGTAYVDNNFASYYRVFSAEGYDSLYIKRYGELLASTKNGQLPPDVPRSDALFTSQDNVFRNRLFDLLGVKYILDKNDNPQSNWEPENDKFPEERYKLVWQKLKWKAYERKTALPRVFLADSFLVTNSDQLILSKMFDPRFDLAATVILEKNPPWELAPGGKSEAKMSNYRENMVVIETQADKPKALFLSDTYYPGWKATLDGKPIDIYRADYIFRSVMVPSGKHTVIFNYDPETFKFGLALSGLSAALLLITILRKSHP